MKNSIELFIIFGFTFIMRGMQIQSVFFPPHDDSQNKTEYVQKLTDEIWHCELDEHDHLDWGHAEERGTHSMFKDGGLDLNTTLGGGRIHNLPVETYTYYGNSYTGSYHIDAYRIEKTIKDEAKKKRYDKNYKPPKELPDNRWWNRYGNYTAVVFAGLVVYNMWQYIKSSK